MITPTDVALYRIEAPAVDTFVVHLQDLWEKMSNPIQKLDITNLIFYNKLYIRKVVRDW